MEFVKQNARNIFIFILGFLFVLSVCVIKVKSDENIQEENYIEEKIVQEEPVQYRVIVREVEPEYYYDVSSVDRELIARLLWTEARGESQEAQIAIVSVVFNRLSCGDWGNTIHDVIYSEGQFDLSSELYKITPNEKEYESVDFVLKNGSQVPDWVLYFRSGHHHNWNGYTPYTVIDNTYFGGYYKGG